MPVHAASPLRDSSICYLSPMEISDEKMLLKHPPRLGKGGTIGKARRLNLARGFTLIEVLVTISIAVILMALAVPSFTEIMTRNRLVTYNNEFVAALATARSEAIRRGTTVSVCKRASDTSCVGGAWSNGWLVVVNTGDVNPASSAPSGPVLRVHEALSSGYTLNANNNFKNYVTFQPDGSANQIGTFAFCRDNQTVGARSVTLTRLRPRVGKDTDDNGIPEKSEGGSSTDIASCTDP
jgi:type IV fimbrial biogenesis protein FimT